MKRKTWIIAAIATTLTAGALAWLLRPRPIEVDVGRVDRGAFTVLVEEDGITRVRDRFLVAAPVSGVLMRVSLRAGDRVARGEEIAIIVPNAAQMLDARTQSELAARVEAAAAHAARARSVVLQTEVAAFQAENDHERLEKLGTGGYASKTELERSALTLELRRKDAEAARFEADAVEHDLQQARAALRQAQAFRVSGSTRNSWSVRAPVDGTVLKVHQESETAIAIGTPILELGDIARLEARLDVLSTEATRIREQAYVELDAGELRLAGRVRRVEPAGYTKVSALGIEEQRVDVLVDLLPNAVAMQRIADGYRVDAAIEVEREEDALRIPVAALFRHGEHWATFRIEEGRARLTPVRVGLRGATLATVLEGIGEGATVVVYPSDAVRDGARLSVR
jgi:HlyD family secretion protein